MADSGEHVKTIAKDATLGVESVKKNMLRSLQNAPFLPDFCVTLKFYPRNTQCIHVVEIFAFLELEPRLNKNRFNWAGKNDHFSKVAYIA